MATRKSLIQATDILRAGGCYNSHLEDEEALKVLVNDWFAAFEDLKDADILAAASAWLETEDGKRWPSKYDLREQLKRLRAAVPQTRKGCDACDRTGWRELIRILEPLRVRFSAPCHCPKGYYFSHPPPRPPNYPGPDSPPPEPFDVVVDAWRRRGFEVLVATADEPHFPLEVIDPSERTRLRLEAARAETARRQAAAAVAGVAPGDVAGLAGVLANKWRMGPKDSRSAEQLPDYDDAPHTGDGRD